MSRKKYTFHAWNYIVNVTHNDVSLDSARSDYAVMENIKGNLSKIVTFWPSQRVDETFDALQISNG